MTLGIGLYAPCMILVGLLGMNAKAAFPIMMGSCAFLMPVSSAKFVKAGSYSPRARWRSASGACRPCSSPLWSSRRCRWRTSAGWWWSWSSSPPTMMLRSAAQERIGPIISFMKSAELDRERAASFTTISGRPIERLYTADQLPGFSYDRELADPGAYPVHARHPSERLSRQGVDDAAVLGVRDARGDQRALQAPAGGRRHGSERRVRPADADGARPGRSALARRSGEVRRVGRDAGRHGAAVRRASRSRTSRRR